jgi:probable HAF family extracellular repeat protein
MLVVALGSASQIVWADSGPYTVQDAGPTSGIALGVNASAVVVGTAGAAAPRTAFRTPFGSGPQPLPGLVGSNDDVAFGVHPDGWAVGHSLLDVFAKPVSFQSGSAVDLAPSALTGAARAVNASGVIAGWIFSGGVKAVVWSNGTTTAVPGTYSQAFALNEAGVVTGTYLHSDNTIRAFTWAGGTVAVLPSLGGFTSEGNGINDQGDVVGDSFHANSFDEIAVLWPASGPLVELGTFGGPASSARDINNHRQIVGYALDNTLAPRAFLSDGGGPIVDLNSLLPDNSGWVLLSANAINDAGQIVGEGMLNGEPRAFLLTPPRASDTTPPVISGVTTTPNSVWPPKHQMVDVTVGVWASDDSGETPACAVVSVASSESDNGQGDGSTASDTEVLDATHVRVRAERSGPTGSRIYTVTVACSDASGNSATGTGFVAIGDAAPAAKAKAKK